VDKSLLHRAYCACKIRGIAVLSTTLCWNLCSNIWLKYSTCWQDTLSVIFNDKHIIGNCKHLNVEGCGKTVCGRCTVVIITILHGRRQRGRRKGGRSCAPVLPRRNCDGDKVPPDTIRMPRCDLLNVIFCKTIQTSLCDFLRFQISNVRLPLNGQKLKVFQLHGGDSLLLCPWTPLRFLN